MLPQIIYRAMKTKMKNVRSQEINKRINVEITNINHSDFCAMILWSSNVKHLTSCSALSLKVFMQ